MVKEDAIIYFPYSCANHCPAVLSDFGGLVLVQVTTRLMTNANDSVPSATIVIVRAMHNEVTAFETPSLEAHCDVVSREESIIIAVLKVNAKPPSRLIEGN